MKDFTTGDQGKIEVEKADTLSPVICEDQSQDPSFTTVDSSEQNCLNFKGTKMHKTEQDSFSHPCLASSKLEARNTRPQKPAKDQLLEILKSIKDGTVSSSVSILKNLHSEFNGEWWTHIVDLIISAKENSILQYLINDGARTLDEAIQMYCKKTVAGNGDITEVFINSFLDALEALPMDQKGVAACSFKPIVMKLSAHKNLDIQRKARTLLDNWRISGLESVSPAVTESSGSPLADVEQCGMQSERIDEVKRDHGPFIADLSCFEKSKDIAVASSQDDSKEVGPGNLNGTICDEDSKPRCLDSSSSNRSCLEAEACLAFHKEAPLASSQAYSKADDGGQRANVIDCERQTAALGNLDNKSVRVTLPPFSTAAAENARMECCEDKHFCTTGHGSINASMVSSINSSVSDAHPSCNSTKFGDNSSKFFKESREFHEGDQGACTGEEASGTSSSSGSHKNRERTGDVEFRSRFDDSASRVNADEISARLQDSPKAIRGPSSEQTKSEDSSRSGEIDFGYVEDDALEVARQVAIEVEREVKCSLSCGKHPGEHLQSGAIDSLGHNQNGINPNEYDVEESKEHDVDSKVQDDKRNSPEQRNAEEQTGSKLGERIQDSESCKLTITSQESMTDETKAKGASSDEHRDSTKRCIFDLNDIATEEIEVPNELSHAPITASTASNCNIGAVSTPIPVVATSKSIYDPPASPPHFKGELGWRGSAATSAFRPACRTYERAQSSEEISPIKVEHTGLELDLNVAFDDINADVDFSSKGNCEERPVPASVGFASCDSSIEVSSSRRVARLNWDLNRVDESDDSGPAPASFWWNVAKEGSQQKPDVSSSPTSSCKPTMRQGFDLNEDPPHEIVSTPIHDQKETEYSKNSNQSSMGFRLMGFCIDTDCHRTPPTHIPNLAASWDMSYGVGKREFSSNSQSFLVSGTSGISHLGSVSRTLPMSPALAFSASPYPYNGLAIGSQFPINHTGFSSGSFPYMMDTLATQVSPQMITSVNMSPSFPVQPFIMSASGGEVANSNSGVLRPNFDLNTGSTISEADYNSIGGGARHMLLSGNQIAEEQMRSYQQSTFSRPTLKRKEPETHWEAYQADYKHPTNWR
eukprot:TRINITY_DN7878_c0_g1_i1.p1 TRINITY_DN7878_c0_g1~~TRINITY_DN7878_c0_g1_i1.p1  ORF type:complete len:1104 (+),score=286.93 TRINITY_DN7878_c0_g1_i1:707-4018(+)